MGLILILLLVGSVFIFLETAFVGGILGIMGLACYLWAIYESAVLGGFWAACAVGFLCVLLCLAALWVWLYVIPKTGLGKSLYLNSSQKGTAPLPDLLDLKEAEGIALTLMAPSGKVELNGRNYDAKAIVGHINAGDKVKVVGKDSFGLKVEKL